MEAILRLCANSWDKCLPAGFASGSLENSQTFQLDNECGRRYETWCVDIRTGRSLSSARAANECKDTGCPAWRVCRHCWKASHGLLKVALKWKLILVGTFSLKAACSGGPERSKRCGLEPRKRDCLGAGRGHYNLQNSCRDMQNELKAQAAIARRRAQEPGSGILLRGCAMSLSREMEFQAARCGDDVESRATGAEDASCLGYPLCPWQEAEEQEARSMEELAQVLGSQPQSFLVRCALSRKPRRNKTAEDLAEHAKLRKKIAALLSGAEAQADIQLCTRQK